MDPITIDGVKIAITQVNLYISRDNSGNQVMENSFIQTEWSAFPSPKLPPVKLPIIQFGATEVPVEFIMEQDNDWTNFAYLPIALKKIGADQAPIEQEPQPEQGEPVADPVF